MAEGFENLDNILRDWAKLMYKKFLSRHWKGAKSRKKKERAISFLENDSGNILQQAQSAAERD